MNTRKPDWRGSANCRDVEDPEIFFLDGVRIPMEVRTAALERVEALCARCPVQIECLDLAMAVPPGFDTVGIFGGLTVEDRHELRAADSTVGYSQNWNDHAWLIGGDRTTRDRSGARRQRYAEERAARREDDPEARAEERADRRFA